MWGQNLGPPGDATAADYARRLGAVGKPEVRELGFGARTIESARPGGYLNFRFTLLVHRDRIAQWRAGSDQRRRGLGKIRGRLPDLGGPGREVEEDAKVDSRGYDYIWSDEHGLGARMPRPRRPWNGPT